MEAMNLISKKCLLHGCATVILLNFNLLTITIETSNQPTNSSGQPEMVYNEYEHYCDPTAIYQQRTTFPHEIIYRLSKNLQFMEM